MEDQARELRRYMWCDTAPTILADLDTRLKLVVEKCILWAESRSGLGLALHGSLTKGGTDEFSDIDSTILTDGSMDPAEISRQFEELVSEIGKPIVRYRADHIGRRDTHIIFFLVDEWVVKLEATLLEQSSRVNLPSGAIVVVEPGRSEVVVCRPEDEEGNREFLFRKLIGWLWFTFCRLQRGELFAAARAVDFSRENALLPIIRARLGLPNDGHRRIEFDLPSDLLDRLILTYPKALSAETIFESLRHIHLLSLDELGKHDDIDRESLGVAMQEMWCRVADARAGYVGSQ